MKLYIWMRKIITIIDKFKLLIIYYNYKFDGIYIDFINWGTIFRKKKNFITKKKKKFIDLLINIIIKSK